MADGPLRSLLVDGVIAGAGSVLVFLPQILILFLFILVLEDSGYLPRAAFLLDNLMGKVGLSGRAFIPLLSSFACAIPGIMATRTIANWKDRLATIMVAPLMTCSARLPVYALLIGAFVPGASVGPFNLRGLTLFGLYVAGVVSAMAVAWVLKRVWSKRRYQPLMLELPPYRMPSLRNLGLGLWERAAIFLRRVGGIIFTLMVVLWFLSSFPAPPAGATGPAIQYSVAGMIGHALSTCSRRSASTGRSRSPSCPAWRRARSRSARSARSTRCRPRATRSPTRSRRSSPRAGRSRPRTRCSPGTCSRRNACRRSPSSSARPTRGAIR